MFVIRRNRPRHDGTRYFNDKGPATSCADRGAVFDLATQAEAARSKLREPHLWEVMPLREAERADAAEHYERQRAARARPFNPVLRFAVLGHIAPNICARPIDASAEAAGAAARVNRLLDNLADARAQPEPDVRR